MITTTLGDRGTDRVSIFRPVSIVTAARFRVRHQRDAAAEARMPRDDTACTPLYREQVNVHRACTRGHRTAPVATRCAVGRRGRDNCDAGGRTPGRLQR